MVVQRIFFRWSKPILNQPTKAVETSWNYTLVFSSLVHWNCLNIKGVYYKLLTKTIPIIKVISIYLLPCLNMNSALNSSDVVHESLLSSDSLINSSSSASLPADMKTEFSILINVLSHVQLQTCHNNDNYQLECCSELS